MNDTSTRAPHTPGPWPVQLCGCGPHCNSYDVGPRDSRGGYREADARLIGAAPELYDALSAVVDDAEDWIAGRTNMTAAAYVELITRRAAGALAKARGEA
jgi:hypothetical protein